MSFKTAALDARYFQLLFQAIFLCYGLFWLGWQADWQHIAISIGGCLFFNYIFESIRQKQWLTLTGAQGIKLWGFSVMISAMSLCLLLKTNHAATSALAALLTVASKYLFRYRHKHLFNPSAFGMVATLLITQDAWLSPGQWGSNVVLFFFVCTLGTIVVTRVQKLDVSLAFLVGFLGLLYWRQVMVLGWPMDYFLHSFSTGSLLLFSFFMISDPRTAPDHAVARIIWAVLIGAAAFYFASFKWKYNTPVWTLVAAAPLVPLLDRIFRADRFSWNALPVSAHFLSTIKKFIMRPVSKKLAASFLLATLISHEAMAFCGFYVSKADGTLKNKTSQVIIVRDGDRNVITMFNDFQGNFKDFAMVVPVPVVLQKSDIKVVDQKIFTALNDYSQPRLVEYYDENPCQRIYYDEMMSSKAAGVQLLDSSADANKSMRRNLGVRIEAQYLVGEYDILILSAKESTGLRTWLEENGYKIPAGADEVLEPYIKSNLKFFVVKVNEKEKRKLPGNFLRPIQISFTSPKFMLPIRLGMANADGDQDMLVYGFSRKGRIECTNYRTVALPTGKNIPLFVQNNFGNFYTNLFQHQWRVEGRSVAMLEYAWDVSPSNFVKCDPCIAEAPTPQDLVQAGVWWLNPNSSDGYGDDHVYFTRLHVRYNRTAFPQDLFFQVTPNTEDYQARYIITHPATGDLSCPEGKKYLASLKQRREDEMEMLTHLTGKSYSDWDLVMNTDEDKYLPTEVSYVAAATDMSKENHDSNTLVIAAIGILGLAGLIVFRKKLK
jgi:hypothetical protein